MHRLGDWLRTGACFVAGTPILTESGSKGNEELKSYEEYGDECDWILSRAENNPAGEVHARRVLKRFIREAPVLNVHVGGRIIGTTAEHPFYVLGFGWKTASELVIGDRLLGIGDQSVRVDGIADSGQTDFVYNVTIEDDHTYFVGCDEWRLSVWAHNACVRVVVDSDTGKAYVYFNRVEQLVPFKSLKDAEALMQKVGHTNTLSPPLRQNHSLAHRLWTSAKIKPAPSVQRTYADPKKLFDHGFFDWDEYQPLLVYVRNGVYYFQNGMTRMENARRFGVTHLPVQIVSSP